MEKEFIPYEQSLDLIELKFDEPCFGFYLNGKVRLDGKIEHCLSQERVYYIYNANCLAPTYQQAFRWFREKYNLLGNVYSNASGWLWEIHDNIGGTHRFGSEWSGDCEESGMFTSFEKAELECLKKLIEIVKEKN